MSQSVVKSHVNVTIVRNHNLGINSLLVIHRISGKLNSFVRVARRVLGNHQYGPRPKNFGDP